MPVKKRVDFYNSEEGVLVKQWLQEMVSDDTFNTRSSYSANGDLYPDHAIPFVQKHMNYLNAHQDVDPRSYISNLRLMTRIRR